MLEQHNDGVTLFVVFMDMGVQFVQRYGLTAYLVQLNVESILSRLRHDSWALPSYTAVSDDINSLPSSATIEAHGCMRLETKSIIRSFTVLPYIS